MRLLVHEWNSFTRYSIRKALKEENIEFDVIWIDSKVDSKEKELEYIELFEKAFKKNSYDAVFSINFHPYIAEACNSHNIMYIAWTYDSPALAGQENKHYFKTNRIFLFDSSELDRHKKENKPNLYHLNLATDTIAMNRLKITPMQRLRFQSDISFVGQLYVTELQNVMEVLDPYAYGFIYAIIDMQMKNYNSNLIRNLITDTILDNIVSGELIKRMKNYNEKFGISEGILTRPGFHLFLQQAVTNRERVLLLALLSKHYNVKLFSTDRHKMLENVTHAGPVDYLTEMPLVFRNSKINLNITAKNIENGIPQRCIDIMGCHGFLLTNHQEDLFIELEEEKDMVTYKSMEEAVDKAGFYLKHDTIRKKIAENGYKKVRDKFNYHTQLGKIWKITGLK